MYGKTTAGLFRYLFMPFCRLNRITKFEKLVYGDAHKDSWLFIRTKQWTFGWCWKHMCRLEPRYEWFTWECNKCRKEAGRW